MYHFKLGEKLGFCFYIFTDSPHWLKSVSCPPPPPPAPRCSVLVTDDAGPGWGLQGVHFGWAGLPTWHLPRVGQEMLGWRSSAQTGGLNSGEGCCLPSPPPCQVACSRMQQPSRCPQVAEAYPSSSLIRHGW